MKMFLPAQTPAPVGLHVVNYVSTTAPVKYHKVATSSKAKIKSVKGTLLSINTSHITHLIAAYSTPRLPQFFNYTIYRA
jgi:hypothetical protein